MPPQRLDLDDFRAAPLNPEANRKAPSSRPPCHRKGEEFLKGPIPWPWMIKALPLGGKALAVAVLLWKQAGCERNRTVRFRLASSVGLGIQPDAARRGLRALEGAGLVMIRQRPGRSLEVTLLDARPEPPD